MLARVKTILKRSSVGNHSGGGVTAELVIWNLTGWLYGSMRLSRRGGAPGVPARLSRAFYILLQSEDLPLVLGAAMLLCNLATIMIVTRRIDWYRLTAREAPSA